MKAQDGVSGGFKVKIEGQLSDSNLKVVEDAGHSGERPRDISANPFTKRRNIAFILLFSSVLVYSLFIMNTFVVEMPSCRDGIQNQNEFGVDCGGVCRQCGCAEINSSIDRAKCLWAEAIGKSNTTICSSIEMAFLRNNCLLTIAKLTGNSQICSEFNSTSGVADCLMSVAANISDPELCGFIGNATLSDSCYHRLALTTRNFSVCYDIKSSSNIRESCIAILTTNLTSCEYILNSSIRDLCYRRINYLSPDVKICGKISGSQDKDLCYSAVAIKKVDFELCALVQNRTVQTSCLRDVMDVKSGLGLVR